jgi:predicted transcriptional regulator
MNRTQIYLTDEEQAALGTIAERTGRSKSNLIREAVDGFIARQSTATRRELLEAARGIWRDRDDLPDFAALRGEWDRAGRS